MTKAKYKVCLDDSGTHVGSQATCVSGIVIRWDKCASLRRSWKRALQRYGVSHFHAKDLEARRNEFSGWDDARHDAFVDDLMLVIGATCRAPIMSGIDTAAYGHLRRTAEHRDFIGSRTRMAFRGVLLNLRDFVRAYAVQGEIHFLIDQGMHDSGALGFLRKQIQGSEPLRAAFSFLGPVTLGAVKDFAELQAADYIAYEHYRHVINAIVEGKPGRMASHRPKTRKLIGQFWAGNNFTKYWQIDAAKSYERWRNEGGKL